MWETIKNNPLLKTLAIAILGVLGFGFAFNIMFGSYGGEMGKEMSGGYSLDNTLAYILTILVKVLFIVLVITAIVVVFKYLRKYLGFESDNTRRGNSRLIGYINADPILKAVTVIVAGLLLIGIISLVFRSNAISYGYSYGMNYGYSLTGIVIYLVRLLLTISVLGAAIGVIALLLQNEINFSIGLTRFFKNEKTSSISCEACDCIMKPEWNCCPKCGKEISKK